MATDNDSAEGRDLLKERDALMGSMLDEPDAKKRKAAQDRVDAIQKLLGQAPIYGSK